MDRPQAARGGIVIETPTLVQFVTARIDPIAATYQEWVLVSRRIPAAHLGSAAPAVSDLPSRLERKSSRRHYAAACKCGSDRIIDIEPTAAIEQHPYSPFS
jgi:hypothetical protein